MKLFHQGVGAVFAGAACAMASSPQAAHAERVFGIAEVGDGLAQQLVTWDTMSPGNITSQNTITGLSPGASLLGIDFRPATFELWGLGSDAQLYTIDKDTGAASAFGGPLDPAPEGDRFGFDFNPVIDRIRIVSNTNQNLVANPENGEIQAVATPVFYADGDVNEGADPDVTAQAYSNNFDGAEETTQFAVDNTTRSLVIQQTNDGILNTVGAIGADVEWVEALDISRFTGMAYAVGYMADDPFARFYEVNLDTGAFSDLGRIGEGWNISGMAVEVIPTPAAAGLGVALLGLLGLRRRPRA
jgi:hypothetical protein